GQRFARIFFARRGEGRRKAVALQGRQRSIAENRPQRLSIFYLSLVLLPISTKKKLRAKLL
ncbi:MAG: hypothetical protein IIZ07_03810, partial [Ruminococcus sp.]|nr:hypothetical protein [Ruminococcus sp.]